MLGDHFWDGFEKQAIVLADFSQTSPEGEPDRELGRLQSGKGPRLDVLTVEGDRGRMGGAV